MHHVNYGLSATPEELTAPGLPSKTYGTQAQAIPLTLDDENEGEDEDEGDSPSSKQRLKDFAKGAKQTTKRLLHLESTKDRIDRSDYDAPHTIDDNAGFNPSKVLDAEASNIDKIKAKVPIPHNPKELVNILRHPKAAVQDKTSETLAVTENPHLAAGDDNRLIEAHDKLKAAQAVEAPGLESSGHIAGLKDSLWAIEDDREQKRTAWTSSRYVHHLRAIQQAKHRNQFPLLATCRWVDDYGEAQGAEWSQWYEQTRSFARHIQSSAPRGLSSIANNNHEGDDEQPEVDQDVLLQEVERIVSSTSPLQNWITDARKLRNWQNPTKTALWLTTWLAVWTCNRIFTFIYLIAIYRVLETRSAFQGRELLKENNRRADDKDEKSNTFSEMIRSHGSANWLEPTIQMVGPIVQPKLRTLADWLEIMVNFTEWKTPSSMAAISLVLVSAILVGSVLSTDMCVRALTLGAILLFFVDEPIKARFPNYYQVLLPLQWILWDVPTVSEISFQYLRTRAKEIRQECIKEQISEYAAANSTRSDGANVLTEPVEVDLFASPCAWQDHAGQVVLTLNDVRFVSGVTKGREELWRRSYADIVELEKGGGNPSLLKKTEHYVNISFMDGQQERIEHIKRNDELFNIIFAFSGLHWRQM